MAVAGNGENVLAYTEYWFDIVNRGGLFPLNRNSFSMFIEIEKCVRHYLPKHALSSSTDRDNFHENVHSTMKALKCNPLALLLTSKPQILVLAQGSSSML